MHCISIYRFFFTGSSSFFPDIPASTATTATMIPATIAFFFLSSDVFFAGVAGFGGAIGAAGAGAGLEEDADLAAFFSFLAAFLSFLDAAGWATGAGWAAGATGAAGVVVVAGALIFSTSVFV